MNTFERHSELVLKTKNYSLVHDEQMANAVIGLTGEAGEVAELVKKYLYHGKSLDLESLKKEVGDVLWYLNLLCQTAGFSLESAAELNIEKLNARYPTGFVNGGGIR